MVQNKIKMPIPFEAIDVLEEDSGHRCASRRERAVLRASRSGIDSDRRRGRRGCDPKDRAGSGRSASRLPAPA